MKLFSIIKFKYFFGIFILLININIKLFSLENLKMVIQGGESGHVMRIVFNKDGNMFATCNMMNDNIKIWSIKGRLLKIIKNTDNKNMAEISFSYDNKYIAISDFQCIKIWGIKDNYYSIIKNNEESMPYRMFNSIVFAKDNKHIIAAVSLNVNIALPKEIDKEEFQNNLLKKINNDFDKEKMKNAYILDKSDNMYKLRFDLESYSDLFTIYLQVYKSLPKNDTDFRNIIELWTIDGKYEKTIGLHNNDMQKAIRTVLLSPDGNTILSYGVDTMIKLWDMNGNLLNTIQGDNPYYISNVCFSNDGKLIGWAGNSGFKICTLNGIFLTNEKRQLIMPDINLNEKFYVESGTKGTTENYYYVVRSRDYNNNIIKESERVPNIMILKISPDARFIIAGGMDGSINIINRMTGRLVTMINDANGEWIVYTPDGYWDASNNGGNLVAMVQGMEAFSIDQFAAKYNRPDIILRRIGITNEDEINHFYNIYKKRLRRLNIKEEDLLEELHVPVAKINDVKQKNKFIDISFNLNDSAYKLKSYNIYINDVPLFGGYGKNINTNNINIKENVELTSGNNKIEVSCINEKGAESLRAMTYINYNSPSGEQGDLYFIGFGVSKYKNADYNLNYADKDVDDLAKAFSKMKSSFKNIYINNFLNKDVTVENINRVKDILKKAKVDDTFILFIAGHGLHDIDDNATYYFLTYNADANNLNKTAANFELIEALFQGIAPRNKLFLMDTCESGEIDRNEEHEYYSIADMEHFNARSIRGLRKIRNNKKEYLNRNYIFENDRYIYNDLLRRSGAIVFSSSKGGEFSYERDDLQNGLFTEEIINALNGKADVDKNNNITTDELRKYVIDAVEKSSKDLQHPTVDRDNIFQKFGFPVVK